MIWCGVDMKNKKAFTLIELLAVVVILGLLVAIAYPAVNSYISETKDTTYTLHEADMKTAASNMMSECIQNDTEDCVPKPGESKTIYLSELVDTKYSNPIKDPETKDSYCKDKDSYVIVTNTGTSTVKLDYQVCLTCDRYASGKCSELEPGGTCDRTTDTTKPVCGEVVGASTLWTNKDRVISVKCSDTGCGCTKNSFYKTFNEGKTGEITITDKAGNSEECEVNVYVDKDLPECELEIIGDIGENEWYGGEAPVVRFKKKEDKTSEIATYGLGLSSKNPEFNKKDEFTVSGGISTVFGYVKDNAGNVAICRTPDIKYDDVPATIDTIDYGSVVYPKADVATVDANNRIIKLDKTILDEYGDIYGFYFYQKSTSTGMNVSILEGTSTMKTVTLSGGVTTPIRVLFGSPIRVKDNNLLIDLGASNKVDSISRIEVITRNDTVGYYTNQNVTLYLNSHDSLSGKAYYTFDGTNFKSENYHTFTQNIDTVRVGIKDTAGNVNDITTIKITNIDKLPPSCEVTKSREKDGNGEDWYKSSVDILFVDGKQVDQDATSAYAKSNVRDWVLNNATGRGDPKKRSQTVETSSTTDTGYVIDNAGNIDYCYTTVKLDLTNPTAGTVTMNAGGSNISTGAKVNKDVTITLHNGSDTNSSVANSGHYTTKYTVVRDGTTVDNNITASKTYSAEGNYTVTVTTFDQSSRSSTRSYTFMIDKTRPVCGSNTGLKTWVNTSRTVSVNCSDPNGVANSGCTSSSFSDTWASSIKNGTITIRDSAGNTNSCTVPVYVDIDKPTCGSISGSSKTWTNQKRTISVGCNDTGGSACKQTSFSKSWTSTTQTDTITISDNAGNTRSCDVDVYVDTTDPYCLFQDQVGGLNRQPPFGYFMLRDDHSGVDVATPSANVGYDYWTYECKDLCGFDVIVDKAGNSSSCYLRVGTKKGYQKQKCTQHASCASAANCGYVEGTFHSGATTGSYTVNSNVYTCTNIDVQKCRDVYGDSCACRITGTDSTGKMICTCTYTIAGNPYCDSGYSLNSSKTKCIKADSCVNDSCTCNNWEDDGVPKETVPCTKSTTCNYYGVTLYYVSSVG